VDTRVHISLEVASLDRSLEFYAKLFQREPSKVRDGYANFRMETPPLHLALVEQAQRAPEPAQGRTNRHYGIELFADEKLAGWLESVKATGLDVRVEEAVTCCYAVADKFWARDPDGHEWEFWVRKAEADAMHGDEAPKAETPRKKAACCAPGQC
jgi:catechol-2,3-dioxygenase